MLITWRPVKAGPGRGRHRSFPLRTGSCDTLCAVKGGLLSRKKTFTEETALDGALEVFAERGYHGTSMQAIAKHLKLGRSTVYLTFPSKLALFTQVLRRHGGAKRAGLSELGAGGSPRAALVRVFVVAGAGGEERPARVLYLLIEAALWLRHREPEIARLVEATFLDIEGCFRAAIERGKAAGEIAAHVDSVVVARVLLSLYFGRYVIAIHGAEGAEGERLRAVVEQVEALLPRG